MNQPFQNTAADAIYAGGVLPIEAGDGLSLAERGLRAEQAAAEAKPVKPVKRKVGRPAKERTPEELIPKPKRKAGRPRKDDMQVDEIAVAEGMRVTLDFTFVRELARFQNQMFKILERRSTAEWKLVSPPAGGIDLEYGYKLQTRLQAENLL